MDLLKKENGTTIIESLVVILLLGILVTVTAVFFNSLFLNHNMLKSDALHLAQQEVDRTLSQHAEKDTSYLNSTGNLNVRRIVIQNENHFDIHVVVSLTRNDSTIIDLNAIYSK